MMEHSEQTTTVSSSKSKLFVIITLCTAVSLIIIIGIFLLATNKYQQQSPTQIAIAQSLKSVSKQSTTCMYLM
jgi:flagellar basal body-associated protein FliL